MSLVNRFSVPLKPLFFISNGNVSQGVLSILDELPIVKVRVEDLPALVNNPGMPSLSHHSRLSLLMVAIQMPTCIR